MTYFTNEDLDMLIATCDKKEQQSAKAQDDFAEDILATRDEALAADSLDTGAPVYKAIIESRPQVLSQSDLRTTVDGMMATAPRITPDILPSYHLPKMRDSNLKTIASYLRQQFVMEESDSAAIQAALFGMARICENRVRIVLQSNGHRHNLNLWALYIAQSGIGKSSLFDSAKRLCTTEGSKQVPELNSFSKEACIESLRLSPAQTAILRVDEYKAFYTNKILNAMIPEFVQLYLGNEMSSTYNNNTEGKKKQDRNLSDIHKTIPKSQFMICSSSTPDWFFENKADLPALLGSGFFGRFLTVYDGIKQMGRGARMNDALARMTLTASMGGAISREAVKDAAEKFASILETLTDNGEIVVNVPVEVEQYLCEVIRLNSAGLPQNSVLQDISSRWADLIFRVAALMELDHNSAVLSKDSIDEAFAYVVSESLRFFRGIQSELFTNKADKDGARILDWMADKKNEKHFKSREVTINGNKSTIKTVALPTLYRNLHLNSEYKTQGEYARELVTKMEQSGEPISVIQMGKTISVALRAIVAE